jgi:mono/diheme cytochrome c family protein
MSSRASADTHGTALPSATSSSSSVESKLRIEGEKRFRTNCGRCHMAPHKFPPRVMATAIRHMRVRAMLTDEDMRLILGYMTQ